MIFDCETRRLLWTTHTAAMTFAQARALITGRRQQARPCQGHWHVSAAYPYGDSSQFGVTAPPKVHGSR